MNDSATSQTIEHAYRVWLRPTPARTLSRLSGARRFVWNWAQRRKDEEWRANGAKLSGVDLSREFMTLCSSGETSWLGTLPREPFNLALRDSDAAC